MTNYTSNCTTSFQFFSSPSALSLVILYVIVLTIGLLGNAYVSSAIWNQKNIRNYLLLNLCASDFLVCGLSAPVSVINTIHPSWGLGVAVCKIIFFLQAAPVAASTWSLMMLSLDRYMSIQHARIFTRLHYKRYFLIAMITTVWTVALAVSSPFLYSRILTTSGHCEDYWSNHSWRTWFVLSHVTVVYLVPGLTVAACHHAVGHKLYAASLSAAAASGDIPLPMPILGVRKEMIIVAALQNDPTKGIRCRQAEEDAEGSPKGKIQTDLSELRLFPNSRQPKTPVQTKKKKSRSIYSHQKQQPVRQSLHSRRRLAIMLVVLVIVFASCWLPYVVLMIYSVNSVANTTLIPTLLPFCLLLGHTHSAINPIVYWLLNRQSFNTSSWIPWLKTDSQREKHGELGVLTIDRRPSSTNEAALGIFHPRFNKSKPRPSPQPRESSVMYFP